MPTDNERRALWFFAIVALSGSVVRLWRSRHPERASDAAIVRQLARVDSARQVRAGRTKTKARLPQAPPPATVPGARSAEIVDIDRATAAELDQLPGIGPALAARIVADRDTLGPFGSVDALCRVRGIGPALVHRVRPYASASRRGAAVSDSCGGASTAAGKSRAPRHVKPR